jgi:hypothetical protein
MNKKLFFLFIVSLLLLLVFNESAYSQCAMCKQNAEATGAEGAKGVNYGIMYLLLIPYALIASLCYWWYVKNKKSIEQE